MLVELADVGEVRVLTVLRFGPYRFFFYAHENRAMFEPPHVHVRSPNGAAAFWLEPVGLRDAQGHTRRGTDRMGRIVVANRERLLTS